MHLAIFTQVIGGRVSIGYNKRMSKPYKYVLRQKPFKISKKQIIESLNNFYCVNSNVVVGQIVSKKAAITSTGLEKDRGHLFSRKITRV